MNQITVKLAQDVSLKDTEVYSHEDIKAASIAEKEKGCWECAGINCLIKQNLCAKYKVKRQYDGGCKEKKATFGDLSKYGVSKTPSASSNTTNIKPSVIDYDSDSAALRENMAIFWESQETNSEEFGFSGNVYNQTMANQGKHSKILHFTLNC